MSRRRWRVWSVASLCVIAVGSAACVKHVPPDERTGDDGEIEGATAIELEDNHARVRDTVTYPGGDRVDWKSIELPRDTTGRLTIALRWKGARPGTDLSIEVYDGSDDQVAVAGPRPHSRRTSKELDPIAGAKGTYAVLIYASEPDDAADYTLDVTYEPDLPVIIFDVLALPVPPPPSLPAVPGVVAAPTCDPAHYDPKLAACKDVCPIPADLRIKACQSAVQTCPTPIDPSNPACRDFLPCPSPPDRTFKACTADKFPACPAGPNDPANPNCDGRKLHTTGAKVTNVDASSGVVKIAINRGANDHVAVGWVGTLLMPNKQPLAGSTFTVTQVSNTKSFATINLSPDTINHNHDVDLHEP